MNSVSTVSFVTVMRFSQHIVFSQTMITFKSAFQLTLHALEHTLHNRLRHITRKQEYSKKTSIPISINLQVSILE